MRKYTHLPTCHANEIVMNNHAALHPTDTHTLRMTAIFSATTFIAAPVVLSCVILNICKPSPRNLVLKVHSLVFFLLINSALDISSTYNGTHPQSSILFVLPSTRQLIQPMITFSLCKQCGGHIITRPLPAPFTSIIAAVGHNHVNNTIQSNLILTARTPGAVQTVPKPVEGNYAAKVDHRVAEMGVAILGRIVAQQRIVVVRLAGAVVEQVAATLPTRTAVTNIHVRLPAYILTSGPSTRYSELSNINSSGVLVLPLSSPPKKKNADCPNGYRCTPDRCVSDEVQYPASKYNYYL